MRRGVLNGRNKEKWRNQYEKKVQKKVEEVNKEDKEVKKLNTEKWFSFS